MILAEILSELSDEESILVAAFLVKRKRELEEKIDELERAPLPNYQNVYDVDIRQGSIELVEWYGRAETRSGPMAEETHEIGLQRWYKARKLMRELVRDQLQQIEGIIEKLKDA